ncbi:hypothetical protein JW868_05050 [Candidatus Woesearchaeota archaeon]|nr:hypothetical protein [Candidatus Woesearchaeota archaeon]
MKVLEKHSIFAHYLLNILVILLFVPAFFVFSGCQKTGDFGFKCPDGSIVEDKSQCPGNDVPLADSQIDDETSSGTQIDLESDQADNTEAGAVSDVEKNAQSEGISDDSSAPLADNVAGSSENVNYPEISGWRWTEILTAMSVYNAKFKNVKDQDVIYNVNSYTTYARGGDDVYDPFWILRSKYGQYSKEYELNNFRINVRVDANKIYEEWAEKKADTKFKLVWIDQGKQYDAIECEKLETCRNMQAVYCKKQELESDETHKLWMWSPTTLGPTFSDRVWYNMHAMDDEGETFRTFEKFYCTSI